MLDRVATSIVAIEPDPTGVGPALAARYAGGYEDYVSQRRENEVAREAERTPKAKAPDKPKTKPGLTYAERIELEGIVELIDASEDRVRALESMLADPSLYATRGHEVAKVQAELHGARAEVARLLHRWETLEAKKDGVR
jgi:ATP-binding cassette subfamily F protein uup